MDGKWLSILEYANFKKKSISTVRRYIKANRVKHREENGKYFVFCKNYIEPEQNAEVLELKMERVRLQKENRLLTEELSELRMLINLYESGQMLSKKELPTLPQHL